MACVGLLAAIGGAAVLYGFAGGGKDSAAAAECQPTQARIAALDPLVHGDVAALILPKASRPVADVAFQGPDGKPTKLSDFRGRVVLLNLWATWCIPCRQEMPALDHLQAQAGGQDFAVVAVNIDTARLERRQAFLKEAGVTGLPFYADPEANVFQVLKGAGKVLGLPTSILVDRNGCEIGTMAGPAEWAGQDARALIRAAAGV